jgi:DNA repair protein RecO (recombination protein O)
MPLHHTEAVVLRRWRTQEADALYLLFTEAMGKVTVKARGVAKTESRLAGILQPYNRVHVILYSKHEDQEVLTVTQASLIRHHPGLQKDLATLSLAACAAELIDACTADAEPNSTLWSLLTKLLDFWDEHQATQAQLVAFALRVLRVTGFEPHLSSCTECGVTDPAQWYYSPERGGIVCPTCRRTERLTLSTHALGVMGRLASGEKLSALAYTSADVQEMLMFLDEHTGYHVGRRSRALRFLQELTVTPLERPDS